MRIPRDEISYVLRSGGTHEFGTTHVDIRMASSFANAVDFAVPPSSHSGNSPTAPRLEYLRERQQRTSSRDDRTQPVQNRALRNFRFADRFGAGLARTCADLPTRKHLGDSRFGQHQRHASERQAGPRIVFVGWRHSGDRGNRGDVCRFRRHAVPANGDAADSIAAIVRNRRHCCRPKSPSCGP